MEDKAEQHQKWWQLIKRYRVAIGVGVIVLVVVIVLIIIGYWFDWTGFNGYNQVTIIRTISGINTGTVTRTEEFQPGKVLWDWLQLLIIPVALAVGALLFNFANTRTEQNIAAQRYKQDQLIAAQRYEQDKQIAEKRYEQDQKLALDKQREDLLHIYLDRMSELLLDKQLRTSEPDAQVRNVARVRTITVLFQLDARRIEYVLAFLRDSHLISIDLDKSIVNLSQADFRTINFGGINLSELNLSGTDLSKANLRETNLESADLSGVCFLGLILAKLTSSRPNLAQYTI